MRDLTQGKTLKTFFRFGFPLVLSGLLTQSYHLIDTMLAGKLLGADALAAIGATAGLLQLVSAVMWGYSFGLSIYVAQMFGNRDFHGIRRCIVHNLAVLFLACVLLGGGMLLLRRPLLRMLHVQTALLRDTTLYFSVCLAGLFFIILNDSLMKLSNALGDSRMTFAMSCLAVALNVGGNLLAVRVLHLGVLGLALASVLAAAVVDLCYFLHLRRTFRQMGVAGERIAFDAGILRKTALYALPMSLQQVTMYFSSAAVYPYVNALRANATAAYTVILRVYDINACLYQGATMTVGNYTAQCIGGQKQHRLGRGLAAGTLLAAVCLLPVQALCIAFPVQISRLFFAADTAQEALDYAVLFLRQYLPFLGLNFVNNLFHAFYRGARATGLLLLVTFLGAASRVAATALLAPGYGMRGVYAAWVLSWGIEAVVTLALYLSGLWKKRAVYL